ASSHQRGDAQVVRLRVCRVGNLTCAAAAEVVREILPRLHTTRIPGAPPVVAGLVNVRGTLVTVVDGWKALGQPEPAARTEGGGAGTIVLLQIGGEQKTIGFTVDEVVDMLAVNGDALEPRQAPPGLGPALVRAVGRRRERLTIAWRPAASLG